MISIFKTSISSLKDLGTVTPLLNSVARDIMWTVDLYDCDRILRVDYHMDKNDEIVSVLKREGFLCVNLAVFHAEPHFDIKI